MPDLEQNKKTALSFLRAVEDRDIKKVDELLSDDGTYWIVGSSEMVGTKTKQEFLPLVQMMMDLMDTCKFHIDYVTAEDERVAIIAHGEMQTKTGIPYNNDYHFLIAVKDGKIQWTREYFDTELMVKAFGI